MHKALTELLHIMNNKKFLNKKTDNFSSNNLDWNIIQNEMKNKLGIDIYESWLKKINFVEEFNNYILLSVPTRFIRDWITSRYLDQILQIIKKYKRDLTRIEFKIVEKSITKGQEKDEEDADNNARHSEQIP